jgi:YidC/Oxa1 family membrane protein insertase
MIEFLKSLFDPLFHLLSSSLTILHDWGIPWWLCIVMLTMVVRTLLFPLTIRQAKNMRKMQELKPEMDRIRKKHKDDSKKQQEELMKLYGERSVNPLGGCLPLLVQLPIFITLYYTIRQFEYLESFRTGGLLWFENLTIPDPYFILPVAYVLMMMASQEIMIRRTNPQQKQLMRILPVAFGIFLLRFPAALLVYSLTTTTLTFFQNLIIYRTAPKPVDGEQGSEDAPAARKPESKPEAGSNGSAPSTGANGKAPANRPARKRKRKKKARKKG